MTRSKQLKRLLLALVLGIWSVVAYEVTETLASGAKEELPQEARDTTREVRQFVYRDEVNDPFFGKSLSQDSSRSHRPAIAIAWTPPPLTLSGIMGKKGKLSALFEATTGEVSFLVEGDTLAGMKILKISSGGITYCYKNQKRTISLDGQ